MIQSQRDFAVDPLGDDEMAVRDFLQELTEAADLGEREKRGDDCYRHQNEHLDEIARDDGPRTAQNGDGQHDQASDDDG